MSNLGGRSDWPEYRPFYKIDNKIVTKQNLLKKLMMYKHLTQ